MDLTTFFLPGLFTLGFSLMAAFYHHHLFNKKDLALSIVVFSLLIFFIVHFVSFEGSLGLGIGLLGILSIVRLRSTPENLIDIAYIFYAITLGLLSASIKDLPTLFSVHLAMTLLLVALSSPLFFRKSLVKTDIIFDELVVHKLSHTTSLKKEIQVRFGVDPVEVEILKIDYLKDSIVLRVTYFQ